jgi:hypothetical protein
MLSEPQGKGTVHLRPLEIIHIVQEKSQVVIHPKGPAVAVQTLLQGAVRYVSG